jgi:hypothetical protein
MRNGRLAEGLMSEAAIHIHEDDWGMRNLYPVGAFFEARADLARSAEASERNRDPGGVGWTDVHVIGAPSIDYSDVRLELGAVADALGSIMPRVKRFTATAMAGFTLNERDPWGSYQEDAYCYGFDQGCFIKIEPEGDLVKQVWFECRTEDSERLSALARAILAIDALAESVIADYWVDRVGRVRDPAFLDVYLRELAAEET